MTVTLEKSNNNDDKNEEWHHIFARRGLVPTWKSGPKHPRTPVLVIEPKARLGPEECSLGTSPRWAPGGRASEPVPVADLDSQPEGGQRVDAPRAGQPADHRGPFGTGGRCGDARIEAIPHGLQGQHLPQPVVERELRVRIVESLTGQSRVMDTGPTRPAAPDPALPQQQLGDPVTDPGQVPADVVAAADQVASGFLGKCGRPDRGHFLQPQ
ncbi:hypothetical protein ACFVYD_25010 [Streptomyces sp. NPDC058301]|uniref:hypothetical protein n=1 Tax=Streptomyces sp. NPDC058301 TaxID=3346436 RepID=UPI0036F02EC4